MAILIKFLVFLSVSYYVNSARILSISHLYSYSHFVLSDRILQELAARGHEVTVITPFEEKVPVKNLRRIVLSDDLAQKQSASKRNMFERAEMDFISAAIRLQNFGVTFTETVLSNPKVQQLLNSEEKFDLVIYEKFLNEAFSGFAHHYQVPVIILSGMRSSRWTNIQMGNPINPSYIVDVFLGYSSNMSFIERTLNTLTYVGSELIDHFWRFPKQNELLQKYFPGSPHVLDLFYNTSLALVNSQVSVNPAVPLVPNMIEIGGYHVEPSKPLPKDLQNYLDNAKDGVIFFSMGSNLKGSDMSPQKRDEILKVFGKLKQKVLWKWEDETLPGQPANVKLGKWFPQQDILAHPNVKLFITHGGFLSIIESIYNGVPILGIPIFGDQEVNIKNAEYQEFGLGLSYPKLNSETFASALDKLLNDPKYTENARRRSKIMRDQPTKPIDRAIYWIEYVLRHNGAPHLRTAALNLSWYQYLLLDVVAAIFAVIFLVIWIILKIVKLCCCKAKSVSTVKKTN